MTRVCVLGLGAMGQRVATNFAAAGHVVTAWSRNVDRGRELPLQHEIIVCGSISAAVSDATFVVSFLTDDDASEQVWLHSQTGALFAMNRDSIGIEMSTISPSHAIRLQQEFATNGRQFVEAPVIGSRPQADSKSLVILASGEKTAVDQANPLFASTASTIQFLGDVGTSAAVKLAINGLLAAQTAAYAEIAALLQLILPDPGTALNIIAASPVTSPAMQRMLTLFSTHLFDPNFPIALVAKDLRYLQRLSADSNAELPVSRAVGRQFEAACRKDLGDLDISAIYKLSQ
jgi:3-hydroxyisobutyrate dehydrogenase